MNRKILAEFTTMCMIYDGNMIFVQDRNDADWPGVAFPGGHVEKGESFNDAVVREIYEETGLYIKNPKLCGIKQFENQDFSRYIVLLYKTNEFRGNLHSSDEGRMKWINKFDLKKYNLAKDFDELFKVFDDDSLSEMAYEKNYENNDYSIKLF